jgi:hypothetical protein
LLLLRRPGHDQPVAPEGTGRKSSAGVVDREIYSLQRYLELLSKGQTVALDMPFAPDTVMVSQPGPDLNTSRRVPRGAAARSRRHD